MKRIMALVLLALTLFPVSACSAPTEKDPDATAENKNQGGELPSAAEEKTETRYTPNLPGMDFGGYEFRAIISTDNIYGPFTFAAEEENGDNINDAVYKRNRYIESKYNVVLKQIEIDLWGLDGTFRKSVMSATDDFDVCMAIDRYGYNLGVEGYVMPAENLPYMDIGQPWYVQGVNEPFSIGGKHYMIYSDECMNMYGMNIAVCFSKTLIRELALDSPYELVKNGKWTYDKFSEMCKSATFDIDGDGQMTDTDRYGLLSQDNWINSNFWVSAGIDTVVKDSAGVLRLNVVGNTKLLDMLDKSREVLFGGDKIYFSCYQDKVTAFAVTNQDYGNTDISLQQFERNQGLFYSTITSTIPLMRSFDVDFGIIPFPKANESQERYYTRNGGGFPLTVPAHTSNPERTSIIFEAVAAESKNTTIPAYKEINLKTKYTRDDESIEMLDIIFDNPFCDLGDVIFLDNMGTLFYSEIRGKGNFTSLIEKNEAKWQKMLDKVNDVAANLG